MLTDGECGSRNSEIRLFRTLHGTGPRAPERRVHFNYEAAPQSRETCVKRAAGLRDGPRSTRNEKRRNKLPTLRVRASSNNPLAFAYFAFPCGS